MRLPLWTTLLVSLITLVIGFGWGRISNPPPNASKQDPQRPRSSSPRRVLSPTTSSSLFPQLTLDELEQRVRGEALTPLNNQNPALLNLLVEQWAELDPYGVLIFAQEEERSDWLHQSLTVLGRKNPDEALQWIDDHITDLGLQNHLTGAVYCGLAQEDPVATITRIEEEKTGPQRDQLLYYTVSEWARQDIESVFDWLETQESTPFLSSIYSQVLGSYIEQTPQDAITLISAMEESTEKTNFANRAAYHLALQGPKEALSWAETLEGEAKHFALMGLMERWGSTPDGLQALEYVKNQPVSNDSEELFSMVMMKLAHSNPEALAQEVPSLTEKQQHLAAVQLAQVYSANSPEKTMQWLGSLQSGSIRDTALKTALNSFRGSDIDQAFQLSETFSDETLRRDQIEQTLLQWMPVDPKAASLALENSSAIPDSRKQIMRLELARKAPIAADFLLPAKAQSN